MINMYQKYQISKSLNGDEVVYLARVGKQKKLVMRASSEKDLITRMEAEAKRFDEKIKAEKAAQLESEVEENTGKKIGLWKPGKMVNKGSKTQKPASKTVVEELG